MASLLDTFPFPWSDDRAQQLLTILTALYPTRQAAITIAQRSGINIYMLNPEQAPTYLWIDILDQAAKEGLTRKLVQDVSDMFPNNKYRPSLDKLLTDTSVDIDSEPHTINGAPTFIKNNDEVLEEEALLYRDDLMMQTGRVPKLIATLQQLMTLAPAVCKFSVSINGQSQSGTGFRISPDWLLTNWHVLHHKDYGIRANAVTAEFGYEEDSNGIPLTSTLINCDVNSILTSKADDWAVIQTKQPLLDDWPVLKLSEAVPPTQNTAAYIIQHPVGERKRLGFVRNQVSFFDDQVVQYLTDTQVGSSGSPVFNEDGRLIALHHRGGRPQEVLGRAPLKKNEGIRISRIITGLTEQGFAIS